MIIFLNNEPIDLPKEIETVKDLVSWKEIPQQGTAIAINDKLVTQRLWPVTSLKENDHVTVISAAFGG
ncbi:MAG: sulfur carrier protein ThiS [Muribaculaceae bacterium]|nr:sulfur carrier protein ThiS [Muribaculaceae bacterium]